MLATLLKKLTLPELNAKESTTFKEGWEAYRTGAECRYPPDSFAEREWTRGYDASIDFHVW